MQPRSPAPLYPLWFAASAVLAIAAHNPGQYRSSDLLLVLASVITGVALLLIATFLLVRLVSGPERAGGWAAALVMGAVAWVFYYFPVQEAIHGVSHRLASDRVLLPPGALLTIAAMAWVFSRSPGRLRQVSGFMSRFGLLLIAVVLFRMLTSQARGSEMAGRSALVRQLAVPLRSRADFAATRNTPPRDIYLIVLDGHANARVLREVFGFDNSRFEDSLRHLGFIVPRNMRSNYVQTYLSVASLLNAAHVTGLTQDAGPESMDHSLPTYLVRNNRVARFLKQHGYKYILFPSAWWAATANSPLADEVFDPVPEFNLNHELRRTELRFTVLRSTLLRSLLKGEDSAIPLTQHFQRSLQGVRRVPDDPAPTFSFAHILLPHIPYLLDAKCRPLRHEIPDNMEADTPEQRADYVGQVRCIDRLVLDLVTALLRNSETAPVILLVGDHGPRFADVDFYGHPEKVSASFIRERFGAFGAFYLPAGGRREFSDSVSLVNVLGHVLRFYFGAELPISQDEMYVSGQQPYRFYRVDPGLLRDTAAPRSKPLITAGQRPPG